MSRHRIAHPKIKVDYFERFGVPPLTSISVTTIRVKGGTRIDYYECDSDIPIEELRQALQ